MLAPIILLVICAIILSFSILNELSSKEETYTENMLNEYYALLNTLDPSFPGRGVLDYQGNPIGDYAKSYAMILSAELMRSANEDFFELSPIGLAAGNWLLDNSDSDGDGVVGWGLPVEWDAYSDGSINPANTEYTITTAIVLNSLLDWIKYDPLAPQDKIVSLIDAATQPYLDQTNYSPSGIFPYSLSESDRIYDTFNPAVYLAGQMQRFSHLVNDPSKKQAIASASDQVMNVLLKYKNVAPDGGWYWNYSIQGQRPNELAHALYIIDGIYNYIEFGGRLAESFDWENIYSHINWFYSKALNRWTLMPQLPGEESTQCPRLYDWGMLMHIMGQFETNNNIFIQLFTFSQQYRLSSGIYTKFPVEEDTSHLVINEYESYFLYGLSTVLFGKINSLYPSDEEEALVLDKMPGSDMLIVPFTSFNVRRHEILLGFDHSTFTSTLLVDKMVKLPPLHNSLPVKVLQLRLNSYIVFSRDFWTSQLRCFSIDINTINEIEMPMNTSEHMFRQATEYGKDVILVLYDPLDNTNYFYRILPDSEAEGKYSFDRNFKHAFPVSFPYNYNQQPHVLVVKRDQELIFAAGSTITTLYYPPDQRNNVIIKNEFVSSNLRILELAADEKGVFAIYKNANLIEGQNKAFSLYDVSNRKTLRENFHDSIPFNLFVDNGYPIYSIADSEENLLSLFLLDIKGMPCSGLMSSGLNNYEGEVIWSQSYYLGGFIDILSSHNDNPLEKIYPLLQLRLDFEIKLIDKLLTDGPGLLCKKFSVDRVPAVFAVQSGKLLLLLKRYEFDIPSPVELKSLVDFESSVIGLENHMEILLRAYPDDKWLNDGRYYLAWPKGVPFWVDGVGVPYNHQNCWCSGILYGENQNAIPAEVLYACKDISTQVLDYEGFRDEPPKYDPANSHSPNYYLWHYWWGQARVGWDASYNISTNTPTWAGDGDTYAIPVYRTFDAISMLIAEEVYGNILNYDILQYFKNALEDDNLELFLTPYLRQHGLDPSPGEEIIQKYIRPDCQSDWRNSVWSYLLWL